MESQASEKRLLLLSNSKNYGQGYLDHALPIIKDFLGQSVSRVLFVPYAGVVRPFDDYAAIVRARFQEIGCDLNSVHQATNTKEAVESAEAIIIGGGNTFHLLKGLYENDLLEVIRAQVNRGVPYIGWSAGSNVACPTIKTTNDMPIVEPPSLKALNLIPFQINPHYLDAHPEGHQGETREERLLEFVEANSDTYAIGLREGSILRIEADSIKLLGEKSARVFIKGRKPAELAPSDSLEFLLR